MQRQEDEIKFKQTLVHIKNYHEFFFSARIFGSTALQNRISFFQSKCEEKEREREGGREKDTD